ncbi:MAG TPA: hypothetical protein VKE96_12400 [Vicinamibacterales bacterium]|nr:hypothetical protein [Vicinamibacterales bacterium]
MATVADLITGAFRRIGVVESNAVPTPEDMADGFLRFKGMLGMWRLQSLAVPVQIAKAWNLVSTKGGPAAPYTFGVGGDINLPRPAQPNALTWMWQDASGAQYPFTSLTTEQYQVIPQKTLTSTLPQCVHYRPVYEGTTSPLVPAGMGAVYLYPIVTGASLQGIVLAPSGVNDPAALTSTLVVPDGYDLPLMDNLARVLWPEWRENVPIDQELKANAETGLAWLKTANVVPVELSIDPTWTSFSGGGGDYDIYADE